MPSLHEFGSAWSELLRSPAGAVLAAIWGSLWGSFANVCIHRIPRGESVVRPASHCPACGKPIAWYDNIPILSWVLLRGRCRRCEAGIPIRYMLVEAAGAILSLLVFWRFVGGSWTSPALPLARFVVYLGFAGTLLVLSVIDLQSHIIPDRITYPAIPAFFLAGRPLGDVGLWDALIGLVAGYALVRLISDGYYYLIGREGLGYGDGKLLALIGAVLGWQALPVVLLLGSLSGILISLPVLIMQRRAPKPAEPLKLDGSDGSDAAKGDGDAKREGAGESLRHAQVPFGPFLALGAIFYLLVLHGRSPEAVLLRLARLFGLDAGQ